MRLRQLLMTLLAAVSSFLLLSIVHSSKLKYRGYRLYRVALSANQEVDNGHLLRWLDAIEVEGREGGENPSPLVDIWGVSTDYVDVLVAPQFDATFLGELGDRGMADNAQLLRADVQRDIDREQSGMASRSREWRRKRRRRRRHEKSRGKEQRQPVDVLTYNSYPRIEQFLKRIAADNPKTAELLNLTKTFEGRDLLAIRIGKRDAQRRPVVFIDGGVHAREWIAPAAALYLIDKLVSALHSHGAEGKHHSVATPPIDPALVERIHFVIVPVVNPDGYSYSWHTDRLWRKTRSMNESAHRWCVGADANRNWGYRWAETGASRSPCSNIFPGWAPFSEPEVSAIRDYLNGQMADLVAYISMHSYGQLILSPWGFSSEKPLNHDEQQTLADKVIEAIREETGTEYTFGTIADMLYPASGTSIDYWQHRGVPYIYGVELRPEESENELHGFAIPPDQIEPSGKEMLAMVRRIAEYVTERWKKRKTTDETEEID